MNKNNRYQQINWYPGHMFKSFKVINNHLKLMDVVFVLVDARIPKSSMNPDILKILNNKPTIILFNKMDLADPKNLNKWLKHYEELGFTCLAIDAQKGTNVDLIKETADSLLKDKLARMDAKGLKQRNFKTMVLGIPNVGKSTLINRLSEQRSTKVGNTPGLTKSKQWVKLANGFDLLDMPGVLWPKFELDIGYNLAITGAIKDNILPLDDIVNHLIKFMKKHYLTNLNERYNNEITKDMEFVEVLDTIGRLRGALLKGSEIDYDRVYQIILTDLRNNYLGRVSFDLI